MPGQIVAQPAAEGRPDGRRDDDGDAVERKPLAALRGWEGRGQNRLRHRRHAAARQPLDQAEDQQGLQIPREAAKQRARREQRNADQKEVLAPEHLGNPAAGAQYDGVGYQVGGNDPGSFVGANGKAARYVTQGHVGDGGVEHFHEGRDRHQDSNDPGVRVAIFALGRCVRHLPRSPQGRTVTVGTTDMPGPSSTSGRWLKVIFTGTRCTTFT